MLFISYLSISFTSHIPDTYALSLSNSFYTYAWGVLRRGFWVASRFFGAWGVFGGCGSWLDAGCAGVWRWMGVVLCVAMAGCGVCFCVLLCVLVCPCVHGVLFSFSFVCSCVSLMGKNQKN